MIHTPQNKPGLVLIIAHPRVVSIVDCSIYALLLSFVSSLHICVLYILIMVINELILKHIQKTSPKRKKERKSRYFPKQTNKKQKQKKRLVVIKDKISYPWNKCCTNITHKETQYKYMIMKNGYPFRYFSLSFIKKSKYYEYYLCIYVCFFVRHICFNIIEIKTIEVWEIHKEEAIEVHKLTRFDARYHVYFSMLFLLHIFFAPLLSLLHLARL